MPGSRSTSCFFADCLLALMDFLGGGDLANNCRGLKGCDWLWELMMVSQMTACDRDDASEDGYVAATQTNNCLVFQLKREVKSMNS